MSMTLRKLIHVIGFEVDKSDLQRAEAATRQAVDKIGNAGRKLTAFLSTAIAGLSVYALKTASDMEQMHIAFEVMIGDAQKAKAVVNDLIMFTAKTPLQMPGVRRVAEMLLAMGIEADNLVDTMRMLGNVARGNQEIFGRVAIAYGQVRTAAKLRGQELRQFTEAGVSLVEELAKITGHSEQEIASNVGKLNVTFEQVQEALKNQTSEGGKFFRLLERQSATLGGMFTTLRDVVRLLFAEFGAAIVKTFRLKELLSALIKLIEKARKRFENLTPATKKLIIAIAAFLFVLGPLLLAVSAFMKIAFAMKGALSFLTLGFGKAGAAALIFNAKLLLIPLIIAAVVAALFLFLEDLSIWVAGGDSLLGAYLGSWQKFKNGIINSLTIIKNFILGSVDYIKGLLWELSPEPLKNAWEQLVPAFKNVINSIKSFLKENMPGILKILEPFIMGPWWLIKAFSKFGNDNEALLKASQSFRESARESGSDAGKNFLEKTGTGPDLRYRLNRGLPQPFMGSQKRVEFQAKIESTLQVPPGNTDEQNENLKNIAKQATQEVFDKELRYVLAESAGGY